jgi:hypothetical protein
MIMRAQDSETWDKYSNHFHVKITEKEVADSINEDLPDTDIEAYLNIMPYEQSEKIFKKSTESIGDIIMNYLDNHKEIFNKLITTRPAWAYCYAIDVLDKL